MYLITKDTLEKVKSQVGRDRMNEKIIVKLYGVGEISPDYAALILQRFSSAYYGLLFLDQISMLSNSRTVRNIYQAVEFNSLYEIWRFDDEIMSMIPDQFAYPLELKGAVFQSPGFWEFIGKLDPLKHIREYLNERHNRKKDNNYRNKYEEKELDLKSKLLELDVIRKAIKVLKEAGVPDDEITKIIRDNVLVPMLKLETFQDANMISYLEIPEDEEEKILEGIEF